MGKAIPVLKILHCGVNYFSSAISPLFFGCDADWNQVIKNFGTFYDYSLFDTQKAIDECCKNRVYLVDPGYTWDNAARQTLEAYNSVLH